VPPEVLSQTAAGNVFDTIVRFLRSGLRAVAVLGLVVALGAFMAGPSAGATRIRSGLQQGIGSLRGSAEAAGWQTGRVGSWIYAHKRALRVSVLIAGGLVLMFWTRPTGWVVVLTALIIVLLLGVIEFLGRPPVPLVAAGPRPGDASPDQPPSTEPSDEPLGGARETAGESPESAGESPESASQSPSAGNRLHASDT
jgi:hypothetical protein